MIVYRLAKSPFHKDLSGKGAELHGGRWNSKGTALLYTSQSRALAFAELSVHLPLGLVPKNYFLIEIEVPEDASVFVLDLKNCPGDWRLNPPSSSTQAIGDAFVTRQEHLVLQVPSALVPGDHNMLVNPLHPQAGSVRIVTDEPFEFDSRFASRG